MSTYDVTRVLASGKVAICDPSTGRVIRIVPVAANEHVAPVVNDNDVLYPVCYQCDGSGIFYMGGPTVNGVYKGKSGPCFRCGGKGHNTVADEKRNTYYDRNIRRIHI